MAEVMGFISGFIGKAEGPCGEGNGEEVNDGFGSVRVDRGGSCFGSGDDFESKEHKCCGEREIHHLFFFFKASHWRDKVKKWGCVAMTV